jgi:hypothetical protein
VIPVWTKMLFSEIALMTAGLVSLFCLVSCFFLIEDESEVSTCTARIFLFITAGSCLSAVLYHEPVFFVLALAVFLFSPKL